MSTIDRAKACFLAAQTAMEARDYVLAETKLNEAIRLDPLYPEALREFGWLLYGVKRKSKEALSFLEEAKSLDVSLDYVDLYMGVVLARLKRMREAEDSFRKALQRTSYLALAHAVFADFLGGNHRKQEAEEQFLAALALNPDLTLALRDYARLLASEGRYQEAKIRFERAIDLDPEDPITGRYFDEFLNHCDTETDGTGAL